ncbi:magnesium transporter [Psychromonas ossibalaenae]|uniref:magnesium transporter n=1 Tax=Psychromonas ossibalaenae TaxID=444922 RepID=UPI000361F173|nr:magnesium transporter [Psychromonas ossibalaenae]
MSTIAAITPNYINPHCPADFDYRSHEQHNFDTDNKKRQLLTFIKSLTSEQLSEWLSDMSLQQCFYIYNPLIEPDRAYLRKHMPVWLMSDIIKLSLEQNPVISVISNSPFLSLSAETSVSQAIEQIKLLDPSIDNKVLFIVDKQGLYCALLELHQLFAHDADTLLKDIGEPASGHYAGLDQEQAVTLLQQSSLDCLAIVDGRGRPAGLLGPKQAMQVMRQEQTEDVELLMGIQSAADPAPYLDTPVLTHVRKRIYWIAGLAAVGILSGMVIQSYEDAITALVILALYMPMVADTGGNAGSQAATVIIRSMALGELNIKHCFAVIWKELRISIFIGVALAGVSYLKIQFLSFGVELPDNLSLNMIGFAIALALFIQVVTSTVVGATLPLLAKFCKQDPAVVASPAITTIVDLSGLLIYFYVTSLLLFI